MQTLPQNHTTDLLVHAQHSDIESYKNYLYLCLIFSRIVLPLDIALSVNFLGGERGGRGGEGCPFFWRNVNNVLVF